MSGFRWLFIGLVMGRGSEWVAGDGLWLAALEEHYGYIVRCDVCSICDNIL